METVAIHKQVAGSFRDPAGFLYHKDEFVYRQVNFPYKDEYDQLLDTGLYKNLTEKGLLIPHEELSLENAVSGNAYKILKPEQIPFISYPFEWTFSQLKDAALTTLKIQKMAMEKGMSLKDCSAYNIQFYKGKPVFIDTLSFEKYQEGKPWVAYKQFCQHFLAPLALMSHRDIRLNQFFRIYIDGIPLDLASSLLPSRTWFRFSLFSHIHLHAKSQKRYSGKAVATAERKISRVSFLGLIDNLESAIKKLKWQPKDTEWGDYVDNTNYSIDALEEKKLLVGNFIDQIKPDNVWDVGANTGLFSRIAADKGIPTLSFDIDPAAVEKNYIQVRKNGESSILPLLLDLTNPSPGIGWDNKERSSLAERGPADAILALALIHHLVISNNVPMSRVAEFFSKMCNYLIIEFVPKQDSKVQRLLSTRKDIFPDYKEDVFEKEFSMFFTILNTEKINNSERTLYLMKKSS